MVPGRAHELRRVSTNPQGRAVDFSRANYQSSPTGLTAHPLSLAGSFVGSSNVSEALRSGTQARTAFLFTAMQHTTFAVAM